MQIFLYFTRTRWCMIPSFPTRSANRSDSEGGCSVFQLQSDRTKEMVVPWPNCFRWLHYSACAIPSSAVLHLFRFWKFQPPWSMNWLAKQVTEHWLFSTLPQAIFIDSKWQPLFPATVRRNGQVTETAEHNRRGTLCTRFTPKMGQKTQSKPGLLKYCYPLFLYLRNDMGTTDDSYPNGSSNKMFIQAQSSCEAGSTSIRALRKGLVRF